MTAKRILTLTVREGNSRVAICGAPKCVYFHLARLPFISSCDAIKFRIETNGAFRFQGEDGLAKWMGCQDCEWKMRNVDVGQREQNLLADFLLNQRRTLQLRFFVSKQISYATKLWGTRLIINIPNCVRLEITFAFLFNAFHFQKVSQNRFFD